MNDFFGIPMNDIMVVLLVALGLSLSVVGYVVLRNRIMFRMGVRNIPRRLAQSVLIVIGLMLSTLIISAALTTGDTVNHSITKLAYDWLGDMDEAVVFDAADSTQATDKAVVPESVFAELQTALANDPDIDGIAPAIFEPVPIIDNRTNLSSPAATMMGVDPSTLDGFLDNIVTRDGKPVDLTGMADDEIYLNKKGADELDARPGDEVTIYVQGAPYTFKVLDIVKDNAFTGAINLQGQGEAMTTEGMVTRLDVVQNLLGREGELDAIAISNRGGVRDGIGLTSVVTANVEAALKADNIPNLEVAKMKQDFVDDAEVFGNIMTTMFVVMGLFSIAAGILLIFMIFVMLAAERKPEMGMTRALGAKRGQLVQSFLSEGMTYNLGSALVGAALGVLVALAMVRIMASLFEQFGVSIEPYVTPRSLIISYSLGVVVTFITVIFSSFRASRLNIVRAIRDIPEPSYRRATRRTLILGIIGILLGLLLGWAGIAWGILFPHALGVSLFLLSLVAILRYLALPERPVFTIVGLLLLGWWAMPPWLYERIYPEMNSDIEMFFLSGIMMVTAATFVIVYNSDLLLLGVQRMGGRLGRILPAVRIAVAYPLANKFRTGMTMIMISLVVFAVVVMSIMNTSFGELFLRDDSRGGWDVVVQENPNNPIGNLEAALEQSPGSKVDISRFTAVGSVLIANLFTGSDLRQLKAGTTDEYYSGFEEHPIFGLDDEFLATASIPLQTRATGYESDSAVWEAVRTQPNLAVIDAMVVAGGGGPDAPEFHLEGVGDTDKVMAPIPLEIRDPASKRTATVQLIGITNYGASASFFGMYLSEETFKSVYGPPDFSRYYIQLQPGTNATRTAKDIEAALVTKGAQADSLKKLIQDQQATFNSFFYLIQGFMGMGLLVGIAAVGVIAFRSVVERRQEIGMLRAIGFKRGAVALGLLLETSFISIIGTASGIGLALLLCYNLFGSSEFSTSDLSLVVPWWQVLLVAAFSYGASFLMTVIPSRQASSIAIAEALRYE
jgi:putative ABC transport system permease protein